MTTQNFFALLGDNENEDPAALIARYSSSPAVEEKPQPKKAQPASKGQQLAASLPSKPLPPAEFVREAQRAQTRGGRGGGRGTRGGFVERNTDREESDLRGGDNGFSGPRRNFNPDQADGNEQRNSGYQGSRGGYRGNRGGYRGGGRAGSYGGYGDSPVGQEREDGEREPEGGRGQGRFRGRGRRGGSSRDDDDQGREREYDRRSGTGRGYELKREGAGRFNWGTETDQLPPKDDSFDASPVKEDNNELQIEQKSDEQAKAEPTENELAPAEEEEDKEMTLDEYEKVLEEKRKALLALKSQERKVDVDQSFQKMQLVDKKSEDVFIKLNLDKDKGKKKEVVEKEDIKPKKAVSINEFLKPAEGENYYGMGNGRGRGRGRGRGGFRGGLFSSSPVSTPRIEDPGQFPTLGAM